jgi:hypothetical protein
MFDTGLVPQQEAAAVRSPTLPLVKLQAHPYGSAPSVVHGTCALAAFLHTGVFVRNVPEFTVHPPLISWPRRHCKSTTT